MKVWLALLAVVAMATSASAAKLVVLATNSGSGTTSGAFPPVGAGQKGFLIGIDNSTDALAPLAFQDLTFSGANLIQRLAPNTFADGSLDSPNVQLRSETALANALDGPGAPSNFAANDSWWWNQAQTVNGQTLTLGPVATGIVGGAPGGPMTMTGSYNLSGTVQPGQWRLAYVVIKQDANVAGLIASGALGFDALGRTPNPNNTPVILDYETGTFQAIPEPSTFALAGLGLMALAVGAWKRRK